MKVKIFKYSVVCLCITFAIGFVITAAMLIKQSMNDIMINDSVVSLTHNVKYKSPAKTINEVPVFRQEISCGYACIEMLSDYLGGDGELTEEILFELNGGKITTSTNKGFYDEIRKQFPEHKITQYKNLKNSEMLDKIYKSVLNNMPVIFAYAAADINPDKSEDLHNWVLHYGLAVEIDIPGDKITVINPYGYIETYALNDFLRATRFENYDNMEFYLKLGFAAGMFSKNTIYIIDEIAESEEIIETSEIIEPEIAVED